MCLLLTVAVATLDLSDSSAHAQQPAEPVPAPVVRIPRHSPPQTTPGTAADPTVTPSPAVPGPSGAAKPVVHRSRPVPSLLPDATGSPSTPVAGRQTPRATGSPAIGPPGTAPLSHPRVASATPQPAGASAIGEKSTRPAPEHPSNIIHGLNRNVIVLDPGHGGTDSGARIGDTTLEKNVTLSLAFRLRSLLLARGFTVVLTRDSDAATMQTTPNSAPTPLTLDDRAGVANHAHAAACLLLHATGRGTGLHIYSSEIPPLSAEPYLVPWLTGQAAWMPASKALEGGLSAALGRSGITLLASTASIRPVDSLTCPALVLELAPENQDATSINDAGYQERIATALAGALVVWENTVQPPPRLPAPLRPVHHTETADTPSTTPAVTTPETQP